MTSCIDSDLLRASNTCCSIQTKLRDFVYQLTLPVDILNINVHSRSRIYTPAYSTEKFKDEY
jgi:hypothetical protein